MWRIKAGGNVEQLFRTSDRAILLNF